MTHLATGVKDIGAQPRPRTQRARQSVAGWITTVAWGTVAGKGLEGGHRKARIGKRLAGLQPSTMEGLLLGEGARAGVARPWRGAHAR